jgi:hypothetical protein
MPESERIRRWEIAKGMSNELGDEMRELVATGKFADRIKPWSEPV